MTTRNLPIYYKKSDGNYVQISYTDTDSFSTLNSIYPVGSVYLSVGDASPGNIFGGTWVELSIGEGGYYLMTAGTKYTKGATGGSNTVGAHSHGLSAGYAKHAIGSVNGWVNWKSVSEWQANYVVRNHGTGQTNNEKLKDAISLGGTTDNGGGHTITPQYIAVRVWKRTA